MIIMIPNSRIIFGKLEIVIKDTKENRKYRGSNYWLWQL